MSRLVRAELAKLTLRKLPFGLLAGAVGFVALTIVLVPLVARTAGASGVPGTESLGPLLDTIKAPAGYAFAGQLAVNQVTLFVAILAAIAVGNEYSWSTMATTLVREPRRGRVLAAKVIALVGLSVAGSLVVFVVCLALVAAVQPLLPADAASPLAGPWPAEAVLTWLRGLLVLAVWVSLATMLAVVTRSPAAAAGIAVGLGVGEGLLALVPYVRLALISPNVHALQRIAGLADPEAGLGGATADLIPAWRAALVLCAWVGGSLAIAWTTLRSRDI
ncbi:MAG: hypothetical protein U0U69_04975 [Acidimicrobiia bacterium]